METTPLQNDPPQPAGASNNKRLPKSKRVVMKRSPVLLLPSFQELCRRYEATFTPGNGIEHTGATDSTDKPTQSLDTGVRQLFSTDVLLQDMRTAFANADHELERLQQHQPNEFSADELNKGEAQSCLFTAEYFEPQSIAARYQLDLDLLPIFNGAAQKKKRAKRRTSTANHTTEQPAGDAATAVDDTPPDSVTEAKPTRKTSGAKRGPKRKRGDEAAANTTIAEPEPPHSESVSREDRPASPVVASDAADSEVASEEPPRKRRRTSALHPPTHLPKVYTFEDLSEADGEAEVTEADYYRMLKRQSTKKGRRRRGVTERPHRAAAAQAEQAEEEQEELPERGRLNGPEQEEDDDEEEALRGVDESDKDAAGIDEEEGGEDGTWEPTGGNESDTGGAGREKKRRGRKRRGDDDGDDAAWGGREERPAEQPLRKRRRMVVPNPVYVDAARFLFVPSDEAGEDANEWVDVDAMPYVFVDHGAAGGRYFYDDPAIGAFLAKAPAPQAAEQATTEAEEAIGPPQSGRPLPPALWAKLVHKEVPRAYKTLAASFANRIGNCRKVAMLCARVVRKRRAPAPPPPASIARRLVREMFAYWRRTDREEREEAKRAERAEREARKREEEREEAKRQQRKLNFLLTQSELYSHFIRKKMMAGGSAEADAAAVSPAPPGIAPPAPPLPATAEEQADQEAARAAAERAVRDQMNHLSEFATALPAVVAGAGGPVEQPRMFRGKLKAYQMAGLRWLVELYEQGINGILADEMGLGKTIQTIALLGHLAETKGIWGPFLIVAPKSTLHNWINEIRTFAPPLIVIPYWGTPQERATLRRFYWPHPRKRGTQAPAFHVMVTSYHMVVQDEKYFQRIAWQYMVLDEAQAIKSAQSARWKSLLNFRCRNRLLLTGTPIQNTMTELWALLHFIMPTLFDSHQEFSDWFVADIEGGAGTAGSANSGFANSITLDEHQLNRLHQILKPFMLRRLKKDVSHELPPKHEVEVYCHLADRQRRFYEALKDQQRRSFAELLSNWSQNANSEEGIQLDLMNLVMQFRKVCNHPEIFERRNYTSPVALVANPTADGVRRSELAVALPKLLFRDMLYDTVLREGPARAMADLWGPSSLQHLSPAHLPFISADVLDRAAYIAEHYPAAGAARATRLLIGALSGKAALVRRLAGETHAPAGELLATSEHLHRLLYHYVPHAWAPPVDVHIPDRTFAYQQEQAMAAVAGPAGSYGSFHGTALRVPSVAELIKDSAKLRVLDALLARLARENTGMSEGALPHKVLLYSQMTKMMDILEDFCAFRRYRHVRLDGSSTLEERRDRVKEFQEDRDVFVFLLSTRAGGLGLNLTAADVVIFYDSDWNPTADAQAEDRAHRLGQERAVTVYRLITKGTIEERILRVAKRKFAIQNAVIGGASKAPSLRPQEVVSLLLEDDEVEQKLIRQQLERRQKRRKRDKEEEDEEALLTASQPQAAAEQQLNITRVTVEMLADPDMLIV